MGIFNGGGDVLDLTLLQKRGILKRTEESPSPDTIDLTASGASTSGSSSSSSSAGSFGSFFDSPASSSSSSSVSSLSGSSPTEVSDLKVRLENAEYKLERALERIAELESKTAN